MNVWSWPGPENDRSVCGRTDETVRAKLASGEYATESEVIRDGLRALLARDQAVEAWLRNGSRCRLRRA